MPTQTETQAAEAEEKTTKRPTRGRGPRSQVYMRRIERKMVALDRRLQRIEDRLDARSLEKTSGWAASVPPIAEVASYLQGHLGQQLVAAIAGVSDPKTVGRWASGKNEPPATREWRLRSAYEATRLIAEQTDAGTARAWFLGSSPFLEGRAPVVALHDAARPQDVSRIVPAALSFLEGSY